MATHTYTYPDCPVCGNEMQRHQQTHQGIINVVWWDCQNCGIGTPALTSGNDVQEAIEWTRKERIRRAEK